MKRSPLWILPAILLTACNSAIPPMSERVEILGVTEDLRIVTEERNLKLCGIVPKPDTREELREVLMGKVSIVRFGNLADVFVPKDGGEIYGNGFLVLEGLATVDEREARRCSDPIALETAEKLREEREKKSNILEVTLPYGFAPRYYAVTGKTAEEIRASINQKRLAETGHHFDTSSQWYASWSFEYKTDNNSCRINAQALDVYIQGFIMMPQWDSTGADPTLVNRWQKYIDALQKHANQYAQHGLDAGQEIREELPKLSEETCEQLKEQTDRKGEEILEKYRQKDREYNERTQHGMLEGVVFP